MALPLPITSLASAYPGGKIRHQTGPDKSRGRIQGHHILLRPRLPGQHPAHNFGVFKNVPPPDIIQSAPGQSKFLGCDGIRPDPALLAVHIPWLDR